MLRALLGALAMGAPPAPPPQQHVVRCRNASDCTAEAQAALDAGVEAVFPGQPHPYIVQPLFIRVHGLTVTFAAGARLVALRGGFRGVGGSLVTAANVTGLTIRGSCTGPPSTWSMWKEDYLDPRQGYANQGYRHGLRLENVHGARISCLTISEGARTGGPSRGCRGWIKYCCGRGRYLLHWTPHISLEDLNTDTGSASSKGHRQSGRAAHRSVNA